MRGVIAASMLGRIDVEGPRLDVDQNGPGIEIADDFGGGRERDRGRDDLVSRAQADGLERQVERGGTGIDRDRMANADRRGEFRLELTGPRTARQPAGANRVDDLRNFGLIRVGKGEGKKRVAGHQLPMSRTYSFIARPSGVS